MSKILWKLIGFVPAVLGVMSILAISGHAAEIPTSRTDLEQIAATAQSPLAHKQSNQNTHKAETLDLLTSVSQLSDVKLTDWVFQALQSLVERYGCISPALIHQGNQALTRYEFAASLNACLNKINNLIAVGTVDLVTKEDLTTLQRLQKEFIVELAILRGRVDDLEAQTDELEAQQFSTTTQLEGEIIFSINAAGGEDKADGSGDEVDSNITFSSRVRLDFETSFTGRDRLQVRLRSRNNPSFADATGTEMASLGLTGDDDNDLELSTVEYRFSLNRQATVYIEADGGSLSDFTSNLNPLLGDVQDSGTGAISRFALGNPIVRQGGEIGAGLRYEFGDTAGLSFGYVADDANEPEEGIGSSSYGAIAQLVFVPSDEIGISLTYVHSYNSIGTGTGSERANDPFDDQSDSVTGNSYGVETSFQIAPDFVVGGWVGFTQARAQDLQDAPQANIFNYAVTFAFPNFGQEGNVVGLVIGQPPKLTNNNYVVEGREYEDEGTSLHLEAFYLFQVADNIAITPGILVIVNPEHSNNNGTVYVGTVRTTIDF